MEKTDFVKILSLLFILSFVLLVGLSKSKKESFESEIREFPSIDIYIITMKTPERLQNIQKQIKKMGIEGNKNIHVELIDAVVGSNLDINLLIQEKKLDPQYKGTGDIHSKKGKNEVGCYLSHLKCYYKILRNPNTKYTLILEDDFDIIPEYFTNVLYDTLWNLEHKTMDFDMVYLGTHEQNHGKPIDGNLYEIDREKNLYGTHAILYKNKNISKLISNTQFIQRPIDVQLQELSYAHTIISYCTYPVLVNFLVNQLPSTIQVAGFRNKNNYV